MGKGLLSQVTLKPLLGAPNLEACKLWGLSHIEGHLKGVPLIGGSFILRALWVGGGQKWLQGETPITPQNRDQKCLHNLRESHPEATFDYHWLRVPSKWRTLLSKGHPLPFNMREAPQLADLQVGCTQKWLQGDLGKCSWLTWVAV